MSFSRVESSLSGGLRGVGIPLNQDKKNDKPQAIVVYDPDRTICPRLNRVIKIIPQNFSVVVPIERPIHIRDLRILPRQLEPTSYRELDTTSGSSSTGFSFEGLKRDRGFSREQNISSLVLASQARVRIKLPNDLDRSCLKKLEATVPRGKVAAINPEMIEPWLKTDVLRYESRLELIHSVRDQILHYIHFRKLILNHADVAYSLFQERVVLAKLKGALKIERFNTLDQVEVYLFTLFTVKINEFSLTLFPSIYYQVKKVIDRHNIKFVLKDLAEDLAKNTFDMTDSVALFTWTTRKLGQYEFHPHSFELVREVVKKQVLEVALASRKIKEDQPFIMRFATYQGVGARKMNSVEKLRMEIFVNKLNTEAIKKT